MVGNIKYSLTDRKHRVEEMSNIKVVRILSNQNRSVI